MNKFVYTLAIAVLGLFYKLFLSNGVGSLLEMAKVPFGGTTVTDFAPDVLCFVQAETVADHCRCLDRLQRSVSIGMEFYNHVQSELDCFDKAKSHQELIACAGNIDTPYVASFVCSALVAKNLENCPDEECVKLKAFELIEVCEDIPHFVADQSFFSIFSGTVYLLDPKPEHDYYKVAVQTVTTIKNTVRKGVKGGVERIVDEVRPLPVDPTKIISDLTNNLPIPGDLPKIPPIELDDVLDETTELLNSLPVPGVPKVGDRLPDKLPEPIGDVSEEVKDKLKGILKLEL